ncbi:MAG: DNA helicase RecG, partial [Clostridia bacterium]|nr:DNA helicase RecG [Clostridia bacterium]
YIVCPLVEESETLTAKAVTEYAESLSKGVFKDYKIDVLHGKMKPKEKDAVMECFAKGETDILVSTTVIEVGVDVPNASVMIIENAERFGLSQLHQLRGRIRRGVNEAFCILFCKSNGEIAKERMKIMKETNDGFKISEKDLILRGPGEFFGVRQHGLPELKIANLSEDMEILKMAGMAAEEILARDKELSLSENQNLKKRVMKRYEEVGGKGILN